MKKLIFTSMVGIVTAGIYFTWNHHDDAQPQNVTPPAAEKNAEAHIQLSNAQIATQHQFHHSPHESIRMENTKQFHHALPSQQDMSDELEVIQLNTADAHEVVQYAPPADEKNIADLEAKRQERTKIELEEQLNILKKNGTNGDVFFNELQPAHNELLDIARQEDFSVNVSLLECFTSGCTTTLTYQKTESIDNLQMKMMSSPAFAKWDGTIYISGPIEVQSGIMESTIVFLGSIKPSKG